ncbi:MAG: helix-turn-helix transcriptional regulator [Deltaproteobacteria bacterium]|nr:helix-turn-helix transcriptional regulator [Deltaproteobacteria bacterium]MBI4224206.1 helix-turn-helix transcriptional regulator [Deltaproteobacteria bacterium]
MKEKGLRKADVARLAGVSRACVTRWFRLGSRQKGWVNVESKTFRQLQQALNISPYFLMGVPMDFASFQTRFLWDRLYPDREAFVEGIFKKQEPALARLVEVLGFHEAGAIAGDVVLKKFPQYKKRIKPIRRRELEPLWPLYHSAQ